jgi:hypothetical protein
MNVQDRIESFNPRPRTEGDAEIGTQTLGYVVFQSTPSHGGRPHIYPFQARTNLGMIEGNLHKNHKAYRFEARLPSSWNPSA